MVVAADHYESRPEHHLHQASRGDTSCGSKEKMREAETICVRHKIQFQSAKTFYNKLSILYSDRVVWVRCPRRPLFFLLRLNPAYMDCTSSQGYG